MTFPLQRLIAPFQNLVILTQCTVHEVGLATTSDGDRGLPCKKILLNQGPHVVPPIPSLLIVNSTLHLQVQHQIDELNKLAKICQHGDAPKVSIQHLTSAIATTRDIENSTNCKPAVLSWKDSTHPTKLPKSSYICSQQSKKTSLYSPQQTTIHHVTEVLNHFCTA